MKKAKDFNDCCVYILEECGVKSNYAQKNDINY